MNSAPAIIADLHTATGPGWRAEIYLPRIYLAVDPEGDALPDAIQQLIAPTQQRFWTVEYLCQDDNGWDIYAMRRE